MNESVSSETNARPLWSQLPDEPARWYARFEAYRALGTRRSIETAYQFLRDIEGNRGKHATSGWYEAARRYRWQERAQAWDQVERDRLRALDAERKFDAREQRLSMIDRLLTVVYNVLMLSQLDSLTPEQAREALPQLRILFRDLIQQQRAELGLPYAEGSNGANDAPEIVITADDMAEAERIARLHSAGSGE